MKIPRLGLRAALSLTAAACLAVAAAGCTSDTGGGTTEGGVSLVNSGKLTVCTQLPYEPFQMKRDGEIVGFDVDMMNLVADELGVEQKIVNTPFEAIKSGQVLNSGKCDVAAAAITITESRKEVLDFSDPYFNATQALLVKEGASYDSLQSLEGQRVGVQSGTTGEEYLRQQIKEKGLNIEPVSYSDLAAEQQALATGQIAAAINDLPVLVAYLEDHPEGYEISAEFDTGEKYGYAVAEKGSEKLLKKINGVIAQAKSDGTYVSIYEKWTGRKPTES